MPIEKTSKEEMVAIVLKFYKSLDMDIYKDVFDRIFNIRFYVSPTILVWWGFFAVQFITTVIYRIVNR